MQCMFLCEEKGQRLDCRGLLPYIPLPGRDETRRRAKEDEKGVACSERMGGYHTTSESDLKP